MKTLFLFFFLLSLFLSSSLSLSQSYTSAAADPLPAVFVVLPRPTLPHEPTIQTNVNATLKPLRAVPATYTAAVTPPRGCAVGVVPAALHFTDKAEELSYKVWFNPNTFAGREDVTAGKVTWTAQGHPELVLTVPLVVRWTET